jgi:hypothetical protein
MEHPYRVHSSIGFGFLQLLMLSSLAYPSPPPPLYHNIALTRLMGTVYFTMFQDKPFYLKLECATILLEVVRDTLYIWYIIRDYTYLFGVFDIVSNLLFCIMVGLSLNNGEEKWAKISENLEGIRQTCLECCWKRQPVIHRPDGSARELEGRGMNNRHMYSSLPNDDNRNKNIQANEAPMYTFGSRQAFKPSFYSSSWGHEYLKAKVEREFDRIDYCENTNAGDIGMVTGTDGSTQYIRFDDAETGSGAHHYANIFVSPYYTKDGTQITSFSGWTKTDTVGACLFIYNLIQFIYQLIMYSSIIGSCREYHERLVVSTNATASIVNERMVAWLC